MLAQLVPFLAVSVIMIVSPGPDTALVLRNSLWGSRRAGAATAVGVMAGLMTWTVAASIGLAALIRASEPAFVALKVAGAAYLVFLGCQALWTAYRDRGEERHPQAPAASTGRVLASFRQGVLSNLANPKIAVFFTTFLPQFVPGSAPSLPTLLLLGFIFCVITVGWLLLYAVVAARVAGVLRRPSVRRTVEGATGVVLIGFGLRLATERRG